MRTLIVIPTYNEKENLDAIVKTILKLTPSELEILVVDDGSPDGTGAIADGIAKVQPRFHVIHRKGKLGLGSAYVAGFEWGFSQGFDAFIEMDADFSHDPKYLATMLELLGTHEVVIGSRYVPGGGTLNWGLGRKILSRCGGIYSRLILGAPIQDFTAGFIGWQRKVLEAIQIRTLKSDGYSFQIELKYRAFLRGFGFKEFPIIFEDRRLGQSKMNRKIIVEALMRVWNFRWNASEYRRDPLQIENKT